jgi:alkanesulfonate monooxygenase SsuD/methylene tetrahydromethanopterin reductase-like flavin-dependent oxidoreductase (luciferase family)
MKNVMSRASTNVQSRREPEFGISITPYSSSADDIFKIAKTADEVGLDLIGIQDHPYNGSFLDTWTLISALAVSTRKIKYFPDVSDLPMRAPAILAKSVATLDILTKGRIELGLGTGAFWDAIQSWGGTRRTPREAVAAYEEALQVIHLIWNYGKDRSRVSFPGKYYRLEKAQAGPSPYHRVSIWTGAVGPRMMRLIGRLTDGWVNPLSTYTSSDEIKGRQRLIDESAKKNGRLPESIRRIAQVVGVIDDQERSEMSEKKPFFLHEKRPFVGSVSNWVDWLVSSYKDLGLDTFIFWPSAEGEEEGQIRIFAEQVVPKLRNLSRNRDDEARPRNAVACTRPSETPSSLRQGQGGAEVVARCGVKLHESNLIG